MAQLELGGNHLRYLVLLLWYTSAPPCRHCTLIKLLWASVALFLLVFEHDLTMAALWRMVLVTLDVVPAHKSHHLECFREYIYTDFAPCKLNRYELDQY